MPTLPRPDVDLYYEISGEGPPLLLIPGMLSDSASWLPLIPLLAPHFTLIRVDNRATGRMQKCAPFTLEDCVNDIAALLDHLDLNEVHVAGHSMGGFLTLMLADRAPKRLASISLLTSAPINGPRNFLLFDQALQIRRNADLPEGFWLRNLFPWFMSPAFFSDPAYLDASIAASQAYPFAQTADSMELQLNALTGFNATPYVKPLPCPAQAILGANDLLFSEFDAKEALAPIRDLKISTIKDAAHSIHWEQPQNVAEALRYFALNAP
ncbi:alpha/beta fold hydrolase [Neptunicoccus cionae]|uniref:Alpha/beta hydrolase fold protein n=1 Tax=Neptunicoccus cionae TaxID=2035344 RepID=A0A916QSQ2_9RHOB|nr:alpha/beta hydrolase [Amylibacter cionae]GGA07966.1 alpha/beta hydrolase fold protein [Amylibacter cionae]